MNQLLENQSDDFSKKHFSWDWVSKMGVVFALLIIYVGFGVTMRFHGEGWSFFGVDNIEKMGRNIMMVGVAALGMTMVMILGGIDLSVGSVVALSGVVLAQVLNVTRPPIFGVDEVGFLSEWMSIDFYYLDVYPMLWPVVAILAAVLAGTLCGLFNGALIVGLRVVPFIITLGTLLFIRGLSLFITGEGKVEPHAVRGASWLEGVMAPGTEAKFMGSLSQFPMLKQFISVSSVVVGLIVLGLIVLRVWGGLKRKHLGASMGWGLLGVLFCVALYGVRFWSTGFWVCAFLSLIVAGVLLYTRFGRHVYAIGSNEQTARLCGIAVGRTKIITYALMGFFAGVAGVLLFSQVGVGSPTEAEGLELDVIAAVVIGGGSLAGGKGSVFGTILGASIMSLIYYGCTQLGVDDGSQRMVTGGIIVIAVGLDQLRRGGVK